MVLEGLYLVGMGAYGDAHESWEWCGVLTPRVVNFYQVWEAAWYGSWDANEGVSYAAMASGDAYQDGRGAGW